jgi:hypothetical protein
MICERITPEFPRAPISAARATSFAARSGLSYSPPETSFSTD